MRRPDTAVPRAPASPAVAATPPDEREWIARVQQHDDRAAFALLVQRHQGAIRAVLRRLCQGHTARADELAQDSFLAAWQALPGFRGDARFRTWLYRIAYHQFLQQQRRGDSRLERHSVPLDDDREDPAPGRSAPDPAEGAGPDWKIDLQRALDALPAGEREAIVHCDLAELTHAEAADVLGRPLGTLKTQVLRGRARLRERLQAWRPPGTPTEDGMEKDPRP